MGRETGMEYYAKSVGKCLSKDRVDRIVENTISLINEYDENGYYELICKLKTYLKNIDIKLSDKEQKTLAAHTQEILAWNLFYRQRKVSDHESL